MQIKHKSVWIWGMLAIVLWAFFYLLESLKNPTLSEQLFFSLAFAFLIIPMLWISNRLFIPKLRIFSTGTQIFIKGLLYASIILTGYLAVYLAEIFYRIPGKLWIGKISGSFFESLALLFSAPLSHQNYRQIFPAQTFSVLLSFLILIALFIILGGIFSYLETRWNQLQTENQLKEARLKLMELQMQPHFLFNTLNAIVSVVRSNPPQAEALLLHFSDFLRVNFSITDKKTIPIEEEIHFLEDYLTLLQARFGSKLRWQFELQEDCRQAEIPVMLLQPLLENAVKHGWQEKKNSFFIAIRCFRRDTKIIIEITDNGCGLHTQPYKNFPPPRAFAF